MNNSILSVVIGSIGSKVICGIIGNGDPLIGVSNMDDLSVNTVNLLITTVSAIIIQLGIKAIDSYVKIRNKKP